VRASARAQAPRCPSRVGARDARDAARAPSADRRAAPRRAASTRRAAPRRPAGPLVIMYVAGVLANGAQDHRRITAAFANALGTTIGAALLIALIERNGVESVIATFPSIFASKTWERSKELIITYGFGGTVVVSMMPIVLHPAVIFARRHLCPPSSLPAVIFAKIIRLDLFAL
jgi:hypothetical protein